MLESAIKANNGNPPLAAQLAQWKFSERGSQSKTYREDDVQAAFCLQQLRNDVVFDGIKLVATEFLMVKSNKRIDVLGVKDSTLYVFEMKKGRDNSAYGQAENYKVELEDNLTEYLRLLKYYPNINNDITLYAVKTIAVMEWNKKHRLENKSHWLYELPKNYDFSKNLVFRKN